MSGKKHNGTWSIRACDGRHSSPWSTKDSVIKDSGPVCFVLIDLHVYYLASKIMEASSLTKGDCAPSWTKFVEGLHGKTGNTPQSRRAIFGLILPPRKIRAWGFHPIPSRHKLTGGSCTHERRNEQKQTGSYSGTGGRCGDSETRAPMIITGKEGNPLT